MKRRNRVWTAAFFALLILTAAIPLGVPFFPTQDGPVHLYYVDILRGLLTHTAPYAQHFAIKSFVTPYALEYYSLLLLEFVFSPLFSEKLLIVAYIFAFGLGFRYLVESVAERGSAWTLAAVPFCLHMLVYMGFLNYSMAVVLLLFACGFWMRCARALSGGRIAMLCSGLVLMLLTHPVPAAVFLTFCGIYLLADATPDALHGVGWRQCLRERRAAVATLLGMGLASLGWVALFWIRGPHGGHERSFAQIFGWFDAVATEIQLYPVAAFNRLRYRVCLMGLLAFAGVALAAGLWKNRRNVPPRAAALLAASGMCFLLFCIVPQRVNGSFYFAERFPILWVLFLLAGIAGLELPRRWQVAAGGLAMAVTAAVLVQQRANVAAIVAQIAPIERIPAAGEGSVGLIVAPSRDVPYGLQFNPFMWCGVDYFRQSRAILANDPWMDLPLIMLRPVPAERWSYLDPDDAYGPFVRRLAEGHSRADVDFAVRMGSSDFEVDSLLVRSGWLADRQTGRLLRIFRSP